MNSEQALQEPLAAIETSFTAFPALRASSSLMILDSRTGAAVVFSSAVSCSAWVTKATNSARTFLANSAR
eukprot:CAMPEP_0114645118 /NCGR_PEP_ID=MMETSP0191-20121206/4359_1 /TAXON_ID=126664 /ORGANISM="Sorites sp." /LENGTH=69 /DNA_ID=CAMNT_0001857683 /DNA_START=28 /DNA_END=234 /DNA_ORIENTATION=-